MLLLQSKDLFDEMAYFDPLTREIRSFRRSDSEENIPMKTDGVFSWVDGHFMTLFRYAGKPMFFVDEYEIELTDDTIVDVRGPFTSRTLTIKRSGSELLKLNYSLSQGKGTVPSDTTPFVEDEDFDFGLFVHNISRSVERKALI